MVFALQAYSNKFAVLSVLERQPSRYPVYKLPYHVSVSGLDVYATDHS
jgi:hypothetical protein